MAYVLIVDDDHDFASAVAALASSEGHETFIALSTQEAEAVVQKKRPDLMILDAMFPENDAGGFEFARTLQKRIEAKDRFPILMLTAVNSKSRVGFSARDIDDMWLPVDDFVEKPLDLKILRQKMRTLLARGPASSRVAS